MRWLLFTISAMSFGCTASPTVVPNLQVEEPNKVLKPLQPTMVFRGTHSQIQKERFEQILTSDAWNKLWEEHRGSRSRFTESEQSLEIDYGTHYAIAIFPGASAYVSVSAFEVEETVRIRYRRFSGGSEGGPIGGTRTPEMNEEEEKYEARRPYAFIILPRPVRQVTIEQDVRKKGSEPPPIWETRVSFPVPDKNK
jgi:hypothetical protein